MEAIPWNSLLGGILLGLSATLLMIVNGKVAGISGILNGIMARIDGDFAWRVVFVLGMVLGGGLVTYIAGEPIPDTSNISVAMFIVAGLLVGAGTRIGNGCTSGHGICGIGRLSKRSLIATIVFMLVAGVTVFIRLHVV
ncbi:YeeE/YedE family protein [Vibrio taketomensis]|uniref:YeeE/YedE family protein n=1 Tax=Vibrio taketomensis TaxID=2572923 RepID=UPI00138A440E|nr:YeeE/YedE thiosulfate transporter family protein [Vibrio taketomensis]